ncbi:hypothetical protein CP061683_0616, partial [Chlamydia psittaci 06-1683]
MIFNIIHRRFTF